jgi:hypothetical protein
VHVYHILGFVQHIYFLASGKTSECNETWLEFDSRETSTNVRARTRPAIYLVRMYKTTGGICDETKDDTGTSTVDSSMRVTKRKMSRVGKRMIAIIVVWQQNVMNERMTMVHVKTH